MRFPPTGLKSGPMGLIFLEDQLMTFSKVVIEAKVVIYFVENAYPGLDTL
jgi:hypothetical protein